MSPPSSWTMGYSYSPMIHVSLEKLSPSDGFRCHVAIIIIATLCGVTQGPYAEPHIACNLSPPLGTKLSFSSGNACVYRSSFGKRIATSATLSSLPQSSGIRSALSTVHAPLFVVPKIGSALFDFCQPKIKNATRFIEHVGHTHKSLLLLSGFSGCDGFVATPFMGARVAGAGVVSSGDAGMSMVCV